LDGRAGAPRPTAPPLWDSPGDHKRRPSWTCSTIRPRPSPPASSASRAGCRARWRAASFAPAAAVWPRRASRTAPPPPSSALISWFLPTTPPIRSSSSASSRATLCSGWTAWTRLDAFWRPRSCGLAPPNCFPAPRSTWRSPVTCFQGSTRCLEPARLGRVYGLNFAVGHRQ